MMLNENKIIEKLKTPFEHTNGIYGIGDDAAVIPINDKESLVISKDLLVEDNHFRVKYYTPLQLARKVVNVNLSDIAAMAAEPYLIMLGLAIPRDFDSKWLNEFLKDFTKECKINNLKLIGGDTTRSEEKLFISITVFGRASSKNLKFRNNAKVDDLICVAGNIGYAHIGLISLEQKIETISKFRKYSCSPKALIKEAIWLSKNMGISSMMDISDGLYIDLSKLCKASGVGAKIKLDQIEMKQDFLKACKTISLDVSECLLTGGEDYSLLFTVAPEKFNYTVLNFKNTFGYDLKTIGRIIQNNKIIIEKSGIEVPYSYNSFDHFGKKYDT
jgi:thiamine-monophosphate kinase